MRKKVLALFLAMAMVVGLLPGAALAAGFADTLGHEAEAAIDRWTGHGVVSGDAGTGTFRPNDPLTRAEMAKIIANLMGLENIADISMYVDVPEDEWYTPYIAMCVAAGILNGRDDTHMDPLGQVTQQEFDTMLGRALALQPKAYSEKVFADSNQVADYASGYVNALADLGALSGDAMNNLNPTAPIPRGEVMMVMDKAISDYVNTDGAEVAAGTGITLIAATDVIVTGQVEDLVVGGTAVTVTLAATAEAKTATVVGPQSALVVEGAADSVKVDQKATGAAVSVAGSAAVTNLTAAAPQTTVEVAGQVGFVSMGETAQQGTVTVQEQAKVDTLITAAPETSVAVSGAVTNVQVTPTAGKTEIATTETAKVDKVETKADDVAVTGDGKVENVAVSGNNTAVETGGTKVEVAENATGTTAGDAEVKPGDTATTTPSGSTAETKPTTPSKPSVSDKDEDEDRHYHDWSSWAHNGNGTHSRVCDCGEVRTQNCAYASAYDKDSSGHWYTCTVCAGTTAVTAHTYNTNDCTLAASCTACGYGKAAGEHQYGSWAVDSADSTKHTHTCGVCGVKETADHDSDTTIPAVDATCTAAGLTEGKKCSVCGKITVEQTATEKAAHAEQAIPAVPATCTETGLTAGVKCSACNEILTAQTETQKIDHSEETVPAVDATCTVVGLTEGKKCSVCQQVLVAPEEIAKIAHNYVTGVCSVCNDVAENMKAVIVDAKGTAVKAYAELVDAVKAVPKNDESTTTIEIVADTYGKNVLNDGELQNKNVIFKGTKDVIFDLTDIAINGDKDLTGTTLTFDGVTVNWLETESYQGLKNPEKVYYKNCAINGLQYMRADAEFENCTFTNKGCWSVWTYGAKNVTFTECTFETGGHAVLVYNEQTTSSFVANITFIECTFNNDGSLVEQYGPEQLVETGTNANNTATSNKYNLTFTDCKITGEGTQKLWGNKNDMDTDHLKVMVDGKDVRAMATIGDNSYYSLTDAVKAVATGGTQATTINLLAGTHTFENSGIYGEKKIVFQGVEGAIIDATGLGNEVYADELTFNDVTMKFPEDHHKGIANTNKIVFNRCTFSGTQTLYAPSVTFNTCTFAGNTGKDIYYVWTYGIANATFNDCTFNTNGKAILCYTEGAVTMANVTLNTCRFYSDGTIAKNKAAVEVGSDNMAQTYTLSFTNCTQEGFAENNSTSPLWGNKNSMEDGHLTVKIDGVTVYPVASETPAETPEVTE